MTKKSTRSPEKLDTRLNNDKKAKLVQFIDEKISVCDTNFVELKDILQNATIHVFGKKKGFRMTGLMIRMRKFKLYFEYFRIRPITNDTIQGPPY